MRIHSAVGSADKTTISNAWPIFTIREVRILSGTEPVKKRSIGMLADPTLRHSGERLVAGSALTMLPTAAARLWLQAVKSADVTAGNKLPDATMRTILLSRSRKRNFRGEGVTFGLTSPQKPCANTHGVLPKRPRSKRRTAPG